MNDAFYELGRWICLLGGLALMTWVFLTLARSGRPAQPRTTCRNCGYDVRETPNLCPECGTHVPDELRLRIDLLHNTPPAFLIDDEHALPLREPATDEPFRPLAILPDKPASDHLLTLLRRAGIASEVDMQLGPGRPRDLFQPHVPSQPGPSFHISVPVGDFPVAMELLDYVRRNSVPE